jgi:hypothetical protein
MNKEKQIEEMQWFIDLNVFTYKDEEKVYGTKGAAEVLYNKGYLKASDVAREIFEEIDDYLTRMMHFSEKEMNSYDDISISKFVKAYCKGELSALWDMSEFTAKLKKKYTEGEG